MKNFASCVLIAVVAAFSQVIEAKAATFKATLIPNPSSVKVLEGNPGVVQFTLRNDSSSHMPNDDLAIIITRITHNLSFSSGDRDDEAFNSSVGSDNCTGFTLGSQGTCTFLINFLSRDLSGVNDKNEGIWDLAVDASFSSRETVPTVGSGFIDVKVIVADPIPEPSSILGFLALGTLGAASTLKRKLKPSKSSEKETTKVG